MSLLCITIHVTLHVIQGATPFGIPKYIEVRCSSVELTMKSSYLWLQEHKGVYRVKLVAQLSQAVEEEEVVPHIVQLISPPFLGRTVLTAGPAKFGMDLTKQEHGVSTSVQTLNAI